MLAGKMKACLCVALAATASGFGSAPGDFVLNPCANPDAFTPEATLPGSCEGIQITDRDVCQNAGCRFSEDPQDADEPCDCGTQELCEGAGGAWSTPPCNIGHHARMSTGKACDDVHVVDAESGDTYQRRFSFWGTACCSDKVPLCCADDDDKLKSDRAWSNRARTASRLTGVHAPKTCTQRATRKRRKFVRGARMTLALRALRRAGSCKRAPARAACAKGKWSAEADLQRAGGRFGSASRKKILVSPRLPLLVGKKEGGGGGHGPWSYDAASTDPSTAPKRSPSRSTPPCTTARASFFDTGIVFVPES